MPANGLRVKLRYNLPAGRRSSALFAPVRFLSGRVYELWLKIKILLS